MSLTVQAAPLEHFPWLMSRADWAPALNAKAIEAVDGAGQIRGMVAFDAFTLNAAHVHVALDGVAAAKALLLPFADYAFRQAGLGVLLATIPSHNRRALALAWGLGFQLRGKTHGGFSPHESIVHLELRREFCPGKWPARRALMGPAARHTRWEDFHLGGADVLL